MRKNLVLSVSDGYGYFDLAPFVESLAKVGYSGHTCVFMGPMTKDDAVLQMKKAGIEVIRYTNTFPFIERPHAANFSSLPTPIHIWNFRHFLYYNYLLEHEAEFANVLLTDIRDVVFQGDPFGFDIGSGLNVAMEDRNVPISDTPSNSQWLNYGYGPEMLAEIGANTVSCAGTILGSAVVIKEYLYKLLTEVRGLKDALNCADQAAHNVMLHQGRLAPVRQHYNEGGPILTVGTLAKGQNFHFDAQGYVLNEAKQRPLIIHQYDRHRQLAAHIGNIAFKSPFRRVYLTVRYLIPLRRGYQQLLKRLKK